MQQAMNRKNYYRNERPYEDTCGEEEYSGYTQEDLDRMYQDAFGGDSEAQWNID